MFVIAQSGASCVDFTGLDIRVIMSQDVDKDGRPIPLGYSIIGYGFGNEVLLAEYAIEQQARDVFGDILVCMKRGDKFYDIREKESKFVGRKG